MQKSALNHIVKLCSFLLFIILIIVIPGIPVTAQDYNSDSLFAARLMEDNLQLHQELDSLELVITSLKHRSRILSEQKDSLETAIANLNFQQLSTKAANDSLLHEQLILNRSNLASRQEILRLTSELEQALQELRDKELKIIKLELEIKELRSASEIHQVKMEGKLDVNTTKLESKEKEIDYLKVSIQEKDRQIREKTEELATLYSNKDNALQIIDSLSRALNKKELEFVKVSERLKIIESQYNEMLAKQTAATNKKKKIRFIQGLGLKSYRTPDWQLAPRSSTALNEYVITNKNSGKVEFDYITGISLSLYDLSKEEGKFTYDAGLFLGFGGQNLFKNFYIGPSIKVLDYFHLSMGANIAEYDQLKSGFSEGDPLPLGWSVTTVNVKEWKTNFYFGMTIDFDLLSHLPKKL